MDATVHRCKSCGAVFDDDGQELDKCQKKRLYCELCLAQKNPWSAKEQQIKRKFILVTASFSFVLLGVLMALNWGKSQNNNLFEYLVSFGLGYLVIWVFSSLILLPVYFKMKKPHKKQIKEEKEKYKQEMEVKKASRKAQEETGGK